MEKIFELTWTGEIRPPYINEHYLREDGFIGLCTVCVNPLFWTGEEKKYPILEVTQINKPKELEGYFSNYVSQDWIEVGNDEGRPYTIYKDNPGVRVYKDDPAQKEIWDKGMKGSGR